MENVGRALVFFVDPVELMNPPEIRQEQHHLFDLPQGDSLSVIQWLMKRRLLGNSRQCEACHIPMSRVRKNGVDGFAWRCRLCDTLITIRRGSFFERTQLKLSQLLLILHGWSRDQPQEEMAYFAKINQKHTIVDWSNFCRDVVVILTSMGISSEVSMTTAPQKLSKSTNRASPKRSTIGEHWSPSVGFLVGSKEAPEDASW